MAATTRATSTEPFPPLESGSRTPASLAKAVAGPPGGDTSPKLNPPGLSPFSLTGVAAAAENRKREERKREEAAAAAAARATSPNPAVQAVQTLMGSGGMSRPSDAPDPSKVSEPLQKVAEKIHIPDNAQDGTMQASPISMSSFGTLEGTGAPAAMTATASDATATGEHFVAEPAQMGDGTPYHNGNGHLSVAADHDSHKALSYSYPGPPPQEQGQGSGPSRGMSLPGYGQGSPRSPASNKRHKCPYCSTDFTRHHNLKSHLLTHSQEKPYVCQTCQARFRRLHDLKRHTKLHTGERPHTCDKCGRRFARGDALARHNKGPGGCAGRRSSFGGDDDEFGGEGMDGIEYDEEGSSPDGRRGSEPNRKRTHLETLDDPRRDVYRQHSSTYPPPYQQPTRPHASSAGNMGPPQVILPGQNATSSPRDIQPQGGSAAYYNAAGQVLPHSGLIESPKPLSPGQPPSDQHRLSVGDASMSSARNRSPSLTTQFQRFGAASDGRTPPAYPTQYANAQHGLPGAPVLPPPTSLAQPKVGSSSGAMAAGPGPSMLHHQQVPPNSAQGGAQQGSNPGSLSSHGRSSGSSIRDVLGHDQNDVWQYVRQLDQRFNRMQEEYELRISRMQEELIGLRQQLAAATGGHGNDMAPTRF